MTKERIFEKVAKIIKDQLSISGEEIKEESNLIEDLAADSLDVVEIIMAIEEDFDIEIPDKDAEEIKTIGQIIEYIEKKVD
ncbi:MAG: acyl carrier protein [Candidatus Shapirobacteria bacterium]